MKIHSRFLLFAFFLQACVTAWNAQAANHVVELGGGYGLAFEPSRIFIAPGDTVTFRNLGGFHNVRSDSANFRCADGCDDSGGNGNASSTTWSFTRRFDQLGNFAIYCEPHGAPGIGMAGVISVEGELPLSSGYTGAWYDPAQSGHGFFIEVLPDNRLLAYWYTFTPDGQQAWLGGVGTIVGKTATVQALRSVGGRFIPNFNSSDVRHEVWGELRFTFTDCNTGKVEFNSVLGFGSGSMNLKRLTIPAGLSCTP